MDDQIRNSSIGLKKKKKKKKKKKIMNWSDRMVIQAMDILCIVLSKSYI